MKRTIVRALAVAAIVAGGAAVVSTPASASESGGPICILTENTWLRAEPTGWVLRTLSAGRGFRVHGGSSDWYGNWYYGHGAEAPGQDGWIPAGNCR